MMALLGLKLIIHLLHQNQVLDLEHKLRRQLGEVIQGATTQMVFFMMELIGQQRQIFRLLVGQDQNQVQQQQDYFMDFTMILVQVM